MSEQPNIVIVLCDQMRRDAMSCAGDPNVSTPHLDRLASNGVRFENAYVTYPICVPSRFSFVTGEYAHTRFIPGIDWQMSPTERTFADDLSDAGYRTAYIGKWHLAGHHRFELNDTINGHTRQVRINNTPIKPELQGGFDYWRGFELRNGPFDTVYFVDDNPEPQQLEQYQTDGLFDLAFEFLDDHEEDAHPFCLVISVEAPHPPFVAPDSYLDEWADRGIELRPNVPHGDANQLPETHERWGAVESASAELYERPRYHRNAVLDDMRGYYAMIENLDDNIGRLLNTLESQAIRDTTATMFISDHGEMMGSHGHMMKQRPFEESTGVPFIISYPEGGIDSGRVLQMPTCTEDWFPTILGLAGMEVSTEKPGADLTSLMTGERGGLDRLGIFLEFVYESRENKPFSKETWRGFVTKQYKYTVKGDINGGEPWQLFDLDHDTYEQHNLVDDPEHETVARRLHGYLRTALEQARDEYKLRPAFNHDGLNLHSER